MSRVIRSRIRPGLPYVTGPGDTGFTNAPGYVGNSAGSGLTDGSAITIASNTTYNFYKNLSFGEIGQPSTPVHNVTFNGCLWENNGYNAPNVLLRNDGSLTFNWCTVRPTGKTNNLVKPSQLDGYQYGILADGSFAFPGTYNTYQEGPVAFYNCDIWGFANATKMTGSTSSWPLRWDHCWIHSSRTNDDGNDHTDGIGAPAGGTSSHVTITGCRIEDDGDTNGLAYQNTPGPSSWTNFTVTNNLFGGWGFSVNITSGTGATPTGGSNIIFTDNVFSTLIRPIYGPLYDAIMASGSGNLWRRNRWLVPAGAEWGNPAHDGWFWIPNSSNIPVGDSDSAFVSLTDYTG